MGVASRPTGATRGHAHRVAAHAGKACSPTTDAHTTTGCWRQHGRASLNDPDTLAAALSNALATSAGCCIDAASTPHRRHSIHRPTAAATPAQRTATALQKWAPQP
jgi:hypothetical protein